MATRASRIRIRLVRTLSVLAVSLSAAAGAVAGFPATVHAANITAGSSVTFSSTGSEQSFVVPAGATLMQVTAVGAPGQGTYPVNTTGPNTATGGKGAIVTALIPAPAAGTTVYVEVGGMSTFSGNATASGGFNGGAASSTGAGGGGGASDLRTVSRTVAGSLSSRLIVAGGGGGAGEGGADFNSLCYSYGCTPGNGGSAVANSPNGGAGQTGPYSAGYYSYASYPGMTGGQGGGGGTQSAGGAGGPITPCTGYCYSWGASAGSPGTLGTGGVGGPVSYGTVSPGGGGGGGYYGGGGGAAGNGYQLYANGGGGGGGAGSSYVEPSALSSTFGVDTTGVPSISITFNPTTVSATCTPNPIAVSLQTTCTATVHNVDHSDAVAPSGTITWAMTRGNGTLSVPTCSFIAGGSCSVIITSHPGGAGAQTASLAYRGDAVHSPSSGTASFSAVMQTSIVGTSVYDADTNTLWTGSESTGAVAFLDARIGSGYGIPPTGSVAYSMYDGGSCGGPAIFVDIVTMGIGFVPSSSQSSPLGAGTYSMEARYSGDGDYTQGYSPCAAFNVLQGVPSVGIAVDDAATAAGWTGSETTGSQAYAAATVTGVAGFTPKGTVTYDLYSGGSCSGTALTTETGSLNAGSVPTSSSSAPLAAGTYSYLAQYSGDTNYVATASPCTSMTVLQGTTSGSTTVHDTATSLPWAGTETTGSAAYDTATVAETGGILPAGTYTYALFGNGTCQGTPSSTETVTLQAGSVPNSSATGPLGEGAYSYLGTYNGDGDYAAVSTGCEPFAVDQPPAITSSAGVTVTVGAPATVTVTAAGFPSGGAISLTEIGQLPSGMTFTDNHDGTATLAGTPASGTVGSYDLTIGAANGVAPSATQNFVLVVAQQLTTTTLAAAPAPGEVGESITLTATVAVSAPASGIPGGTVTFSEGGNPLAGCTALPLAAGQASCTAVFNAAGLAAVSASYGGSADAKGSISGTVDEQVGMASTRTSLSSSLSTAVTGQVTLLTATVSRLSPASGSAGGTVLFSSDGTVVAGCSAVPVVSGVASCDTSWGSDSSHAVTASYLGDVNDVASTSGTQYVTVSAAGTTVALSPLPSTATSGEKVTITITVKAAAPGGGNPTGTVTVRIDGIVVATVQLDSTVDSRAQYSTDTLPLGAHAVTASYSGDGNYLPSSLAAPVVLTVNSPPPVPATGSSIAIPVRGGVVAVLLAMLTAAWWTFRKRRVLGSRQ